MYVDIKDEEALVANFRRQLGIHNKIELTDDEFNRVMIHLDSGSVFDRAEKLRDKFSFQREDGSRVWIEFLNPNEWCKNEFQVSRQITDEARRTCRFDVTILVNGLPLVQVELKKRGVELKQAYNQVQRYHKTAFKGLFQYIQILIISNGIDTRYFANNPNQGFKFTFRWATIKNEYVDRLEPFAHMFFDQCTLGKMLAKYVVLHKSDRYLMVLRPYQYHAVEALIDRVKNSTKNGYIWHTTGSGKTLTSFKAAQLISELPEIDKVVFVVDRHDLDTQTKKEYEAFAPGSVDSTDDTRSLVKTLLSNKNMLITTIQKLNHAVQKERFNKRLQGVREQRIIMIFDECHRSQFGDMHKNITGFFTNLRYFGFTGTPILAENAIGIKTTKDIFGDRLHEYLIKDAIADENVLGFLVEYHGKWERKSKDDKKVLAIDTQGALLKDKRMVDIVDFVLDNHKLSTYEGEFNAIFAVGSVPMLIKYYDLFKKRNKDLKIASIFSYTQNEDTEDDLTGTNSGFADEKTTRDKLDNIMDDYNAIYGTDYDTDHFNLYYDDINKRMKNKQINLLLVVNMFLTGFDAKCLNTLYVDKNMKYHGLLQAFSRTNRILNEKKKFGKIICFRDLKEETDDAIRLFSDTKSTESVLMRPYPDLFEMFNRLAEEFLKAYPDVDTVGKLQSETDKKKFVIAFREMLRLRTRMQGYNEYSPEELGIDEQLFADFQSKYLDMSGTGTGKTGDPEDITQDIDFELELIHRDVINVSYIIALLQALDPESKSYDKDRKAIIDVMEGHPTMRSKVALIDEFIKLNIDGKDINSLPKDVDLDLDKYLAYKRNINIKKVAKEENVDLGMLEKYITEYEYLGKFKNEIVKEAVKPLGLPLIKRMEKEKSIIDRLKEIIKQFSWT